MTASSFMVEKTKPGGNISIKVLHLSISDISDDICYRQEGVVLVMLLPAVGNLWQDFWALLKFVPAAGIRG
jgi:hypothetical protein